MLLSRNGEHQVAEKRDCGYRQREERQKHDQGPDVTQKIHVFIHNRVKLYNIQVLSGSLSFYLGDTLRVFLGINLEKRQDCSLVDICLCVGFLGDCTQLFRCSGGVHAHSRARMLMIAKPVSVSKFPVGSSARRRGGSLATAWAKATRWRSPPLS